MGTRWWVVLCALALALYSCSATPEEEPNLQVEDEEEQEPRERVRRQSSCKDLLDYCAQWPDKYCQDYKDYMKRNCPRKCGYCSGPTKPPACADKSQHCSGWKASGFCAPSSQWHGYMKSNCAKTCGFCGGGGGGGGGGGSCGSGAASNKIKGCKFDGDTCDWHDVPFDDQGDFMVKSGSSPGGPSSGAGGSGGYIVTSGNKVQLSLPLDVILDHNANHGNMCFSFHYYMNSGGSLKLFEVRNERGAPKSEKFQSGNQGSQWRCAKVTVEGSVHRQLLFEATGSGVALDNFSFADGACA